MFLNWLELTKFQKIKGVLVKKAVRGEVVGIYSRFWLCDHLLEKGNFWQKRNVRLAKKYNTRKMRLDIARGETKHKIMPVRAKIRRFKS